MTQSPRQLVALLLNFRIDNRFYPSIFRSISHSVTY
jgi:hypothetical protein